MENEITIDLDTNDGLPAVLQSGGRYTVFLKTQKLMVSFVEVPDIIFSHNSAIPCLDSNGWLLESAVSAFTFAHNNSENELVIFGHTDRSGENEYNLDLSELRSKAYLAILLNDVEGWKTIAKDKSVTADYQIILKTLTEKHGWDCDPGEITGSENEKTKEAVKKFQSSYNSRFTQNISIDGDVGPQTWEAFLKTYRYYIEKAVKTAIKSDSMPAFSLGYNGSGVYPCGECLPKSPNTQYRSQEDRRIEAAFYEKGALSGTLIPPGARRALDHNVCPITNRLWYKKKITGENIEIIEDAKIEIVSASKHFAPGAETLDLNYNIKGCKDSVVYLEVFSDTYPGKNLYKEPIGDDKKNDGDQTINWNGKTNCKSGPLAEKYINPLYSPYKIRLYKDETVYSEENFNVYFHSLVLKQGTYTADENAPDKDSEHMKWVQYKLNELGYFSGPVDGIKGPQTTRAIRRYTYRMAGYYGNPPLKEIDDENNATFNTQLENNEGKVEVLKDGKFPAEGEDAKGYIEHDYFYRDTSAKVEFGDSLAHCKKEKDKLDRFEIPLQCSILLVSKNDNNGTGQGVAAAAGANETCVEWNIIDPAEDTDMLPEPTPTIPFKGKAYIEDALEKTRKDATKEGDDNCPENNNYGQRKSNDHYFRIGDKLPPFTSTFKNSLVLSNVYYNQTEASLKNGTSGILFRGSYIAGDNYHTRVQIHIDGENGDKSREEHDKFFGTPFDEKFVTQSGMITLWRKQHISAIVNWPDPGRNISWDEVATQYEIAHCELDPDTESYDITDLLSTPADQQAYLNLVHRHYGYAMADMAFDENGLYPRTIRPQGPAESPDDYKDEIYDTVNGFANGPNSDPFLNDLSELLFRKVRELRPAGGIILRPNWCREYIIRDPSDPAYLEHYIPEYYCYGGSNGMTLMDNPMTVTEQDGFLYGHELGHCRFLMHHETNGSGSDNPDQHDTNDHNCLMCYPDGIASRPGLTWNKGNAEEPRLCGKCILKLRGWDNTDIRLPASS